ncbi:dephospho-CoA kinase [Balneola sp. MJW-20]|uniref:dephospho-CoA kinase n=1 Tax=Gracilimonas aurantiaca TaxID=3234185 RepID=UPI003464EFC7
MIIAGITGGIGSGKTSFCKIWEDEGVEVIYLDDFAKELMVSDQELIKQIKNTFGDESYYPDGTLNRKYLAAEAFEKGRVSELNALVHPALWKKLDQMITEKREQGLPLLAIEAAILLNKGRPDRVDSVILIESDRDEQIQRVKKRDGISEEKEILSRLNKQPDFSNLHHLADHVIYNNGSLEELQQKALKLLDQLTETD